MNSAKIVSKKICRVGNSRGIVIPKNWLDEMGLSLGDFIVLKKDFNKIVFDSEVLSHDSVEKEAKEISEAISI